MSYLAIVDFSSLDLCLPKNELNFFDLEKFLMRKNCELFILLFLEKTENWNCENDDDCD